MQILGCKAVSVVRIRMTIDEIGTPEKRGMVSIIERRASATITVYVPKKVVKDLAVGDVIEVLCIPSPDLKFGWQTFALAKKRGNITDTLFSENDMWQDLFSSLVF